jgi:hypothetical protein
MHTVQCQRADGKRARERVWQRRRLVAGWLGLIAVVVLVSLGSRDTLASSHQTAIVAPPPRAEPAAGTTARVKAPWGKLPLYFIENRGQVDPRVAYYIQGQSTTVYFTSEGVTLALTGPSKRQTASETPEPGVSLRPVTFITTSDADAAMQRWTLKLEFVGANPTVQPTGQDPTPAVISYFTGPQEQWQTGLKTYSTLVYVDLWPGIDLVYSGIEQRLKYTFMVKPGADPQQIRLAYHGATGVQLSDAGELEVTTPVGVVTDDTPLAYQELAGQHVAVAAAYTLEADAAAGAWRYGFQVGAYDRSQPLVLDPAMLVYAGYIGGTGNDLGVGIAVDSSGNAYVTGWTLSTEASFPVTGGRMSPSLVSPHWCPTPLWPRSTTRCPTSRRWPLMTPIVWRRTRC